MGLLQTQIGTGAHRELQTLFANGHIVRDMLSLGARTFVPSGRLKSSVDPSTVLDRKGTKDDRRTGFLVDRKPRYTGDYDYGADIDLEEGPAPARWLVIRTEMRNARNLRT